MKKSIMILGTIFFLFTGWSLQSNAQETKKEQKKQVVKSCDQKGDVHKVAYQCPMKCEGDKTYDKPGKCPKCGMELKKVEAVKTAYQCPMKCEGDKTYDKPGKCPKCGMELKKVEAKTSSGKKK